MPGDLHSRLALSFARFGTRTLVEAEGKAWTYGEVEALSARLATRLAALSVAPGERVLVQTEKSVETLLLYFAVVRLGGIYLPLNVDYTEAELDYFASDATPVLAVCRTGDEPLFARIGEILVPGSAGQEDGRPPKKNHANGDDENDFNEGEAAGAASPRNCALT